MTGLTLDTGALIGLERRDKRVLALIDVTRNRQQAVSVPSPVIVEWWRGQRGPAARLLDAFEQIPLDPELARVAGRALGEVGPGPSVTDAVVMASAAQRQESVLTGDIEDLSKLQAFFPGVRLLQV